MRLRHVLLPLVAVGVTVTAAVAADKNAKGIVAVRQNVMDAQGSHMAAINAILKEDPQAISLVVPQAEAIADTTATIPEMFPKGSDQPPTNALPPVWDKPDEFKAAAQKAHELARKLADTAKGGDAQATLAAFGSLGKEGCGGCHETFRKKPSQG
jgi:cytochrome c556